MRKIDAIISDLAFLFSEGKENPNLEEWFDAENISLPLAFAVKYNMAKLTEAGSKALKDTHDYVLAYAKANGLANVYEFSEVSKPVPQRKMIVTI